MNLLVVHSFHYKIVVLFPKIRTIYFVHVPRLKVIINLKICLCDLTSVWIRKYMASQNSEKELIVKRTLHAGNQAVPFKDGTKIHFHFQTRLCNAENTVLDDSRKMGEGKPLELVLGKKFKLEVWEAILQKMALNEVAEFTIDKSLVVQYPFVSKTIRDSYKPKSERRTHCCAMTLQNEGVGYNDLNELWKNPCNLQFIMEIVKVEQPENYEKEVWQMGENEKISMVPKLRQEGNFEYKNKNYTKAADLYAKAVGILEQLMLNEKPHDVEWNELEKQKIPILLNFAQCKLLEGDYYAVIEHCNSVINSDKENVKAYYRRAKAHSKVWNFEEARRDFHKVMELDQSQTILVKKDLAELEKVVKLKDSEDKMKFTKLFT